MPEPLAYLNGRLLPASQAVVPVYDAGFVQGATVSEQLRTFRGQLFRLDEHLTRLWRSLEIVGIDPGLSRAELADVAVRLVAENHRLLTTGDDLGLAIFVTPGPYATLAPTSDPARQAGSTAPTVGMHTYPLPFQLWSKKYDCGETLVVPDVRQVPGACWPAELKCRSRMHYFLADRQASAVQPGAKALLTDVDGFVSETATANVIAYFAREGLVSPPRSTILPGISLRMVLDLARRLGVATSERAMSPDDLQAADEVFLSSTPSCLLPVTSLDGRAISDGRPGSVFTRLLQAWSDEAGIDIAAQAQQFADRRSA